MGSSSGQASPQATYAGGQAALILIMVMAVVGAVSVGVASTAVENLRTQEIENVSSQAFRAADAGLELALSTKGDIPETVLAAGGITYQASYAAAGSDGFLADGVVAGDVVGVDLVGSSGLTGVKIHWNSNAAIMAALLKGDSVTGAYSAEYVTADPDAARRVDNKFSAPTVGGSFKGVTFDNSLIVPIDLADSPPPVLIRVLLLYSGSMVGIEPIGGTLATGQVVSAKSVGKVVAGSGLPVVTTLSFSKFSERAPVIFDNVLYSKNSIVQ